MSLKIEIVVVIFDMLHFYHTSLSDICVTLSAFLILIR